MLSESELERIFAWKPYRTEWPVDRSALEQTVLSHYGPLIKDMVNSPAFDCTQTQTGETTNYLEFLCYPPGKVVNIDRAGVLVCVSLCAPLVAYGETVYKKDKKSFAYAFPDPGHLGVIETLNLLPVEKELKNIFSKHQLEIVSSEYAAQPLNKEMADNLDSLNFGHTKLHALFQWRSAI
ncbi:MAG: hypothetical protein EOO04_17660 [Chitinophagaceae bacterium]|nr:MAG: hypothetical protein EOO04_17660 [Chitinophagaceae bacterium]